MNMFWRRRTDLVGHFANSNSTANAAPAVRAIEHRIGDRRIIRLIAKWLTAGVLEAGRMIETEEGTPQGAVLHHVYDQWVHQWRQRCATGDVIVVRYADDSIVGFEHRHEAEQFLADLKERLADSRAAGSVDAASHA